MGKFVTLENLRRYKNKSYEDINALKEANEELNEKIDSVEQEGADELKKVSDLLDFRITKIEHDIKDTVVVDLGNKFEQLTVENHPQSIVVDGERHLVLPDGECEFVSAEGNTVVVPLTNKTRVYGKTVKDTTEEYDTISKYVGLDRGSDLYPFGTQIVDKYSYGGTTYDCPMNVVDHHDAVYSLDDGVTETTARGLWLEWEYTNPVSYAFDPSEAMACVSANGLPAGTYYYKIAGDSWGGKNGAMYEFTTDVDLTEDMLLRPNGSYDSNTSATFTMNVYNSGRDTTVIHGYPMTKVESSDGVFLGTLYGTDTSDAAKQYLKARNNKYLNHYHCIYLGYNSWKCSFIRQYLNASGTGWWTSQHIWDRAPSNVDTIVGFLDGLSAELKAKLKPTKVKTLRNTVTDDGGVDITWDKIFLADKKQMCWAEDASVGADVYQWEYYRDLADKVLGTGKNWANYQTYPALIKYAINGKTSAQYAWTRSASRSSGYDCWSRHASGRLGRDDASGAGRCLPACIILGE